VAQCNEKEAKDEETNFVKCSLDCEVGSVRELETMNELENTRNGADTPFVYFVSGTPAYPPNRLYDAAREAIGAGGDFREELKKRIENGLVGGTWTIVPKAWWFHFLLQYVDYFRNNFSDSSEMEASALEILRLIMESSPDKAWDEVLGFVIKNIDSLSGWNKSWIKQSADRRGLRRGLTVTTTPKNRMGALSRSSVR
jgi:hypothetical protein